MIARLLLVLLLAASPVLLAQSDIARTLHNLTPEGPGAMKESAQTGLCVFCHTPHNGNPARSMWNRETPGITYQLYSSTTLRATLKQPTGSSRLCLSCHDGFVAMGNLKVPPPGEALKLGPMTGSKRLGTDLSDDHPVSFVYDSALAAAHPGIADPANLPRTLPLDRNKEVQCTTCHNAHEARIAHFLRMDNAGSALCQACHRPANWNLSSHAISPATWKGTGTKPWPDGAAPTVSGNGCRNCHRTHSAGHGPQLLNRAQEPENCNACHDGSVAQKDVAAEFANAAKFSRHPIDAAQWTHEPLENAASMPRHVACQDCHNPHAATSRPALPPLISGALQGVRGVAAGGSPVQESTFEFQVCGKCHGFREPTSPGITRVEATRIVSTKIDPGNRSFHPIAATGRNPAIQGLIAPLTASSMIGCTSCHDNSDWATAAGTAPKGPHASRYAPILARNYLTADRTPESAANYELCYGCHSRPVLLQDGAGFPHRRHVVDSQAPCAACHDAHGSRQNPHLVNFMTRDANGAQVVAPTAAGRLEYVSTGVGSGACSLSCHGKVHDSLPYGAAAAALKRIR